MFADLESWLAAVALGNPQTQSCVRGPVVVLVMDLSCWCGMVELNMAGLV